MVSSVGVDACNKTIHRLLKRMARHAFSEGNLSPTVDQSPASIPATPASLPEYFGLKSFADREEYHARLTSFVRAGAVRADWDRNAGEQRQLTRLTLGDPVEAAKLLSIELPWIIASTAIQSLEKAAAGSDLVIDHVIAGWTHGKAPGGIAAEKASQFVDSIRVIVAARRLGASNKDLLLRRVSAQLFGDSKHIESLGRPIAYLLGESDNLDEGIFSRLGLVKHPQPMLLSGAAKCRVKVGQEYVSLPRPYIGIRPDNVDGLSLNGGRIKYFLTIENLASFNEAAEFTSNPDDLLLVYVAGNPTPSLLAAYKRLLRSANPEFVMHWGDIDVGGFRIAARLAEIAIAAGHQLQLWQMNSAEWESSPGNAVSTEQIAQIELICERYGWAEQLAGLKERPRFQEQELINWTPPSLCPVIKS